MKNWIIILVAVMLVGTIFAVAGDDLLGGDLPTATTKDYELKDTDFSTGAKSSSFDKANYDGLTYKVIGDEIILNKENVFNDYHVAIDYTQDCLKYFDDKSAYKGCETYTTYKRDDLIKRTIIKTINNIEAIKAKRETTATKIIEQEGKITINKK